MFIRIKDILINMDNITNIIILDNHIEFNFSGEANFISLKRVDNPDTPWELTPDEFEILKEFLDDKLEQYKII